MSTNRDTLEAARRAVADYQRHGQMGDDRARWADFHALRAALDLLAALTAPPDEEREREIADRLLLVPEHMERVAAAHSELHAILDHRGHMMARMVPFDVAEFFAHARADIPYLLAQLAAARAERDTLRREVEGMRAAAEAVVAAWTAAPERSMPGDTDITIARLQSVLRKRAATAALGGPDAE